MLYEHIEKNEPIYIFYLSIDIETGNLTHKQRDNTYKLYPGVDGIIIDVYKHKLNDPRFMGGEKLSLKLKDGNEVYVISVGSETNIALNIINILSSLESFNEKLKFIFYKEDEYFKVFIEKNGQNLPWKYKYEESKLNRENLINELCNKFIELKKTDINNPIIESQNEYLIQTKTDTDDDVPF